MRRQNNQTTIFEMEEYGEKDRVAYVARKLYSDHYRDVRRPDRTRLWKGHTSIQGVLSVAIRENAVPYYSKGRARYIKEDHAKDFLDEYIRTRINTNGTTKSPVEDRELKEPAVVEHGFISRLLGIDKLIDAVLHSCDIQLRILEQMNELNETWKPTDRSNDTNGSVAGVDK